ncbi:pyruvate formate-lyase 1-activating enzyme [Clostridium sp. CAG:571]|nr:pyruvate formate-lyase 1-activating enzyme [Clostridium sp. CAG:571]HJJ06718.1 pyruvate formate-lyase-activating protein [Clostridiaceae bacterium]
MSNLIGRVHSFETFGAVDGPGIRFVIFMQGCSLQCKYCQNRDTWEINAGNQYSAEELLNKILKYKNYFLASGGGVTVSGGEPLLQYKFLIELFTLLKKENIHTAIDTSGNVDLTDDMKKLIDLTDLFLLDIKCINDEICKKLTGLSNKKELVFAKYLSSINKPTWIRQVIVPTITDRTEDLLALKDFLSTLTNVEKIELLPYHDLGKSKWIKLGLKYELENIRVANNNDIEYAKRILGIS